MNRSLLFRVSLVSVLWAAAACDGGGSSSGSPGGSGGTAGAGATGGAGAGETGGTGGGGDGGGPAKPPVSPYIVVDQLGYRPAAQKIAVVRDPEEGFDAAESFSPGDSYEVVDAKTGEVVFSGPVTPWNGGAVDPSSGDRAFWFDFSSVQAPGSYFVRDASGDVRSFVFRIAGDVYKDALVQAVRTFFYQRAGQEKKAEHAGEGWADGASHVGPLQDKNCRRYNAAGDASTEKDLSGGWYDAGDYNKYTNWTARYVITLLRAYEEAKGAFGDDTGIPESGNGIPDVLDEAKWGMDWLVKMQDGDGSVLSIVGMGHASPPSAATGQSLYGSASTSATLSTAAAFAYGAKVLGAVPALGSYSNDLASRAEDAWTWAIANPDVLFYNNDGGSGTAGLGAGQQEVDDYGRLTKRVEAAAYLFETTGKPEYRSAFDAGYNQVHLVAWGYAYPFEADAQLALLHYTKVPGATAAVANNIRDAYSAAMGSETNLGAIQGEVDPYRAYLKDYTWGSNAVKAFQGSMFHDLLTFGVGSTPAAEAVSAAERYVHYLHGTNPLSLLYLSNMYDHGGESCVNELYHSWFTDGSEKWDRVGSSTYGPAPGFLVGGPNPSYDWDGCCPSGCGSDENNAVCTSEPVSPPKGQPAQKAYKDFNTSWPLNSWSVTENSNGYQVAYIRLLSKLVE